MAPKISFKNDADFNQLFELVSLKQRNREKFKKKINLIPFKNRMQKSRLLSKLNQFNVEVWNIVKFGISGEQLIFRKPNAKNIATERKLVIKPSLILTTARNIHEMHGHECRDKLFYRVIFEREILI